jgi:hypothetical protein
MREFRIVKSNFGIRQASAKQMKVVLADFQEKIMTLDEIKTRGISLWQ